MNSCAFALVLSCSYEHWMPKADKNVRARVSGRCWVYWVERNPMGEIATTVAVGQAAIHEGRARKGRQQTFDRS